MSNQPKRNHYAGQHKRAARCMVHALTLGDYDAWEATSAIWAARLADQERAALSFAALKSLQPEQAATVVEAVFSDSAVPFPPLISSADEAAHWASRAEYSDIKACTLAGFNRLTSPDRAALLNHVQGRAA